MRTVADRSLYLTGFFADSFHRKIVDIDYYVDIGSAAYSNLYHASAGGSSAMMTLGRDTTKTFLSSCPSNSL